MPNLTSDAAEAAALQIEQLFEPQLETLKSLVRIPGIAWDAFDPQQLEASARAVANLFDSTGLFQSVEILRAEKPSADHSPTAAGPSLGAPAVVAHRPARGGAPQILLYAHHDVQPQGDESLWNTSPFEPVLVADPIHGDRIFGRGAADDKAGIIAHHTALLAVKQILGTDFDLGVTLFVEGEEEAGSPSFRNFLEKYQERLAADVIVVADSSNFSTTVPAITTTLRGLVSQVFEVRTLDHALHSGMYGGVVPDAMLAMVRVLASLHDEVGHVAVAGLHQGHASDLPYSEAELRADSGLLPGTELIGSGSILDRIWARPSLTIIGVDVPAVAVSSNTMQPSVRAKVSMRLAPGQDPNSALEALQTHLETNLPFGAQISFGEIEMGSPFAAETGEWAHALMSTALSQAYGTASVDIGIGGSIPFIADLKEIFADAQILVTGVEDPDSRAHSPNESVHLPTLKAAMTAETLFLLGANARAASTSSNAGQE
jgi:acetylornithine deacetylase/succinyl-diaminopimelate desuccinylase-like protein